MTTYKAMSPLLSLINCRLNSHDPQAVSDFWSPSSGRVSWTPLPVLPDDHVRWNRNGSVADVNNNNNSTTNIAATSPPMLQLYGHHAVTYVHKSDDETESEWMIVTGGWLGLGLGLDLEGKDNDNPNRIKNANAAMTSFLLWAMNLTHANLYQTQRWIRMPVADHNSICSIVDPSSASTHLHYRHRRQRNAADNNDNQFKASNAQSSSDSDPWHRDDLWELQSVFCTPMQRMGHISAIVKDYLYVWGGFLQETPEGNLDPRHFGIDASVYRLYLPDFFTALQYNDTVTQTLDDWVNGVIYESNTNENTTTTTEVAAMQLWQRIVPRATLPNIYRHQGPAILRGGLWQPPSSRSLTPSMSEDHTSSTIYPTMNGEATPAPVLEEHSSSIYPTASGAASSVLPKLLVFQAPHAVNDDEQNDFLPVYIYAYDFTLDAWSIFFRNYDYQIETYRQDYNALLHRNRFYIWIGGWDENDSIAIDLEQHRIMEFGYDYDATSNGRQGMGTHAASLLAYDDIGGNSETNQPTVTVLIRFGGDLPLQVVTQTPNFYEGIDEFEESRQVQLDSNFRAGTDPAHSHPINNRHYHTAVLSTTMPGRMYVFGGRPLSSAKTFWNQFIMDHANNDNSQAMAWTLDVGSSACGMPVLWHAFDQGNDYDDDTMTVEAGTYYNADDGGWSNGVSQEQDKNPNQRIPIAVLALLMIAAFFAGRSNDRHRNGRRSQQLNQALQPDNDNGYDDEDVGNASEQDGNRARSSWRRARPRRGLTPWEMDRHFPVRILRDEDLVKIEASNSSSPSCCSICLVSFHHGDAVRDMLCHHYFHKSCIDHWLPRNDPTCPLCRSAIVIIPPDAASTPSRNEQQSSSSTLDALLFQLFRFTTRPQLELPVLWGGPFRSNWRSISSSSNNNSATIVTTTPTTNGSNNDHLDYISSLELTETVHQGSPVYA